MIRKEREEEFSILLVENDGQDLNWLRKNLQKDPQFASQIDTVTSIDEALEKIQKKPYHVLLVESEIQQKSGLALLEKMRRQNIRLPFVLMTPVWDDRLVREAFRAGVSELIVKSEKEVSDLSSKLRACYERFYGQDAPAVERNVSGHFDFPDEKQPRNILPAGEGFKVNEDLAARPAGIRDELTGLYNHSYLHERIVLEISKAVRYRYPLSCLMLDIDHFKMINEEFGYPVGDQLLKECAALLLQHCRLSDIIARYGGEEFTVILPHIDYPGALDLARRLRLAFAKHRFMIHSREVGVTISAGISVFPEDNIQRRGELLIFASNALAHSKASGRNRVTLYREINRAGMDGMPELKIREDRITEFQRRMTESAEAARRSYIEASTTLIMALESKDPFTAGHAARCAKYAKEIADVMGLAVDDGEIIQHAALLHDIGKICIPDEILLKTSRLSFSEFEIMKQHSFLGYKILKPIKFLREEAQFVLHHHEWFNGQGYPCRLKGKDIPLGSRIIAVADSYDTMRNAGARYKDTCRIGEAVAELINCAGTQFDPQVVRAFIEVLRENGELTEAVPDEERLDRLIREADDKT